MKPTPIIVTDYIGRPVTKSYKGDIQSTVEYPCPTLANTEPGKTILAYLQDQVLALTLDKDGKEYYRNLKPGESLDRIKEIGRTTRQIWVPIVEQKEEEGIPNSTKLLEMCKSGFDGYIAEEKRNGNIIDESFYGVFQTGYMAGYFDRSTHHQ